MYMKFVITWRMLIKWYKNLKEWKIISFGQTCGRKEIMHITYIRFCFKTRKAFCLTIFWGEKYILMKRSKKYIYGKRNLPYPQMYISIYSLLQINQYGVSCIIQLPRTVIKTQSFFAFASHISVHELHVLLVHIILIPLPDPTVLILYIQSP